MKTRYSMEIDNTKVLSIVADTDQGTVVLQGVVSLTEAEARRVAIQLGMAVDVISEDVEGIEYMPEEDPRDRLFLNDDDAVDY